VIGALALVGVTWAELPPRDYRESLLGAVESEADRLIGAGALDEALALVRDFREEVAEDARLVYEESLILNLQGDARAAEARARDALALDPTLAVAWYDMGGLLLARGEDAEAEAAYTRAAEATVEHPQGWAAPIQLALIAARRRDPVALERWLRESVRRGLRLRALGEQPQWAEVLAEPDNREVHERLMLLYGEAGP
jgi:tetratricopeptide (TPR) repeat protein